MASKNGYGRRNLLTMVGAAFGLTASELKEVDVASAKKARSVGKFPFIEIALGHEDVPAEVPMRHLDGDIPYLTTDDLVTLVRHDPGPYEGESATVSANGTIKASSENVFGTESRYIPVSSDPAGVAQKILSLHSGVKHELPSVDIQISSQVAILRVDGERFRVHEGEQEQFRLSSTEVNSPLMSGEERQESFDVTPVLEVIHHGEKQVIGSEDELTYPLDYVRRRVDIENKPSYNQSEDIVTIPKEVVGQ